MTAGSLAGVPSFALERWVERLDRAMQEGPQALEAAWDDLTRRTTQHFRTRVYREVGARGLVRCERLLSGMDGGGR